MLKNSQPNIQYFIFIFAQKFIFGITFDLYAMFFHWLYFFMSKILLLFYKLVYEKSICQGTQKLFLRVKQQLAQINKADQKGRSNSESIFELIQVVSFGGSSA